MTHMDGKKARGKNVPWHVKERAYVLVTKDNHSYRDVAEILGVRDAALIYRWVEAVSRDRASLPIAEKTIDTTIPIPDRKPARYYLRLAYRMNEGDSIYFEAPAEGRRMYRALRDMGFLGRTRTEGKGMRVWKLSDLDAPTYRQEAKKRNQK